MAKIIQTKDMQYEIGHCGHIKKLFEDDDIALVHLKVDNAEYHYHKITTEYYYVVKGKGKIKLNGEDHEISEGDLIKIKPRTKHKAFDEQNMEILIAMIPPLAPDDTYPVKEP